MLKTQKGDLAIIIIFIILIGGILFLQFIPKSSPKKAVNLPCVNPDTSISVTYNGSDADYKGTYYRIRGITAVPNVELTAHFGNIGTVETVYGQKDAYKVIKKSDGNPTAVGWDKGAFNLLFIDISDLTKERMPGYKYFEIYLKKGADVPDFVKTFCSSNQPIDVKEIMQDNSGNSFPPVTFNTDQIALDSIDDPCPPGQGPTVAHWCKIPPQQNPPLKYYLFSYEGRGSDSWNGTVEGSNPVTGSIKITLNGITKVYKVFFAYTSSAQLIGLLDTDQSSPDSNIIYKYTQAGFLAMSGNPTPMPTFGPFDSLQLRTFSDLLVYPWGWWSPECKPAIYLYPTEKTNISVKVDPAGFLTYTDPLYPSDGWQVTAYPSGKISANGKDYNYLYYESKIRDGEINKPAEGYVVSFSDLPKLYDRILPKLGLNSKETKDFKIYWEKVLKESPYYFVGIMDSQSIEKIEPLTVNPKPESIIRVRLYFEALDVVGALSKKLTLKEPTIVTPQRTGYSLVEWGGLVKVDKTHPFTCSQ